MANEEVIEQKEKEAPKKGRPKAATPTLNEESQRLTMSKEQKGFVGDDKHVTVQSVGQNLVQLYNSMLGVSTGMGRGWEGGLFGFGRYNPFLQNQRLKMINTYPSDMDTEQLSKALMTPGGSEIALRGEGWSLSSTQYLYYKILRLAADIPMFKYYKTPSGNQPQVDYKKPSFINEDIYVDEWLKHLDVVNTFKRISLEVKREGKPSYLLRSSVNFNGGKKTVNYAAFQKLPSNYVKLTGIGEHGYIASLNMMMFLNPMYSLDQYPDFIREIWDALVECGAIYKRQDKKGGETFAVNVEALSRFSYNYVVDGQTRPLKGDIAIDGCMDVKGGRKTQVSYMYWVQLPQDFCFTFCSDNSNAWAIPDTAGMFLGLRELTDYDTLAGLIQSTPLTAILTAEAETVTNPNPGQNQTVLAPETIAGFQDKFNLSTSTNLEAFFAPMKNFKIQTLPNAPNSSDITQNATKNFISRAGLSALIPVTDKPSVAQIKGSQLIEEAACDFVTKQIESVLNFIINDLIGCEYKWNIYLWGNIFTYKDELSATKELFTAGASFALPKLASAYGMTLRDVKATTGYIDSMELYDAFKTITQVKQEQLQEGGSGRVGRPEIDVDSIENDNTAASRESGLDTAEMRYQVHEPGKCVICGDDCDDGAICEDCLSKLGGD